MKSTQTHILYSPNHYVTDASARPAVLVTLQNSLGTGEYCLEYEAAKSLWSDLGHAMRKMAKEHEAAS